MAEIWDAYDKEFNKIDNVTLVRGENIPDGMYHLVGEIIVKHKDGTYKKMSEFLKGIAQVQVKQESLNKYIKAKSLFSP